MTTTDLTPRPALAWTDLSPAAKQAACGIVCTAVEGGVNYWAAIDAYRWQGEGDLLREDTHAVLHDAEDEEAMPHRLDGPAALRGLECLASGEVRGCSPSAERSWATALHKLLDGGEDLDLDAGDADCIAQAALFGEIVYG